MSINETIARWLSPELARKADERDWLVVEIGHNARWLSEIPFMSRTMDRILCQMVDWFRPYGEPAKCEEPQGIWDYRELLRAERLRNEGAGTRNQQEGEADG